MTEYVEFEGQFANITPPWKRKWVKRAALALAGVIPVTALVMTVEGSAADCASIPEYRDIEVRNFATNDAGWTRLKVENYFGIGPSYTSTQPDREEIVDIWQGPRTCADGTTMNIIFHRFEEGGLPRTVHYRVTKKCLITDHTECTVN